EATDDHQRRRERRGQAVPPQPGRRGPQQRRHDQRQQDREDPDPQLAEQPEEDRRTDEDDEEAHGPPGEPAESLPDDGAAVGPLGARVGGLVHGIPLHTRVGLTSTILPRSPLTKRGDSSVLSSVARATASLTATPSGMSSAKRTSQAPRRRIARSTPGIRSRIHPWR